MTEQIKLTISDCGRGDLKEIAVEQVGRKTKFIQYADSDYKRNGELKASWFKANGFRGRLFIYDAELGRAYFVTVKSPDWTRMIKAGGLFGGPR
jgi:hypothetical protein